MTECQARHYKMRFQILMRQQFWVLIFLALPINILTASFQNDTGIYECYYRCQSCTDVSLNSCTSCYANYILIENACEPCADNCISCLSTTGRCQTCASQFYLSQSTWQCNPCPTGAQTCTFSQIQQCLPGYYLAHSICFYCLPNCRSCSDASNCSVCNSGYYLSSQGTCLPCSVVSCSVCQSNSCSFCSNNRYGTNCLGICPNYCQICDQSTCYQCQSGYFLSQQGVCEALSLTCSAGQSPWSCISCLADIAYLDGDKCLPYTSVHQTNKQYYYRPLNQQNRFSGKLLNCGAFWIIYNMNQINIRLNLKPSYLNRFRIQAASRPNQNSSIISIFSPNFKEDYNQTVHSNLLYPCGDQSWVLTNIQINLTPITEQPSSQQQIILTMVSEGQLGLIELLVQQYLCLVSNCGICRSAYSCVSCIPPFLLENNKCLAECSSGYYYTEDQALCTLSCMKYYYPSLADYVCIPCKTPCLTCSSLTQCLTCNEGWFLMGKNCLQQCPIGYFKDSANKICQPCQYPCSSCDQSAYNCTRCALGFLSKEEGTCSISCKSGLYSNFSTITCDICSSNCAECKLNSQRCIKCFPPYFLNPNGTCLNSCDIYYASNPSLNICQKCKYPCQTCYNSSTTCSSCSSGYLQGLVCVSTCKQGTYNSFEEKKCLSCPDNCSTCVSKIQCTSCVQGIYFNNLLQSCFQICPSQTFPGIQYICHPCISPCKTCLNSTYCLGCQGFLFVIHDGMCLLSCPQEYYVILNQSSNVKYCKKCGYNCSICISQAICVTCLSSFSLSLGLCLQKCPQTTYKWNGICNNCLFPCKTCEASDICSTCFDDYFFYNETSSCLKICPSGYAQYINQCIPCSPQCQLCKVTPDNCLSCSRRYYKHENGSCLQSCNSNQYPYPTQRTCKKCVAPCLSCLSSSLCLSCNISSLNPYKFRYNCLSSCPNGYFANSSSVCQICSSQCIYCYKQANNCTKCSGQKYFLSNFTNRCVDQCPSQYFANSAAYCTPCLSPCLTCTSQSFCLSCISNSHYYFNGNCLLSCPSHYFSNVINNQTTCSRCADSCLQCSSKSTNCSSCGSSLYLQAIKQNPTQFFCDQSCPKYYYTNVIKRICQRCQSPCMECFSQLRCISCLNGFYLQFDMCLATCLNGYFPQGITCQKCQQPCSTCTSDSQCLTCIVNYYYDQVQSKCVNQCPNSTYSFESSNGELQCLSCPKNCMQCFDSISCKSCDTQSVLPYLQGTTCQAECTEGYYYVENSTICQWCGWGCLTCDNSGICSRCSNSFLYTGVCQMQCPIGYYGSLSFTCQTCTYPCYDCYDSANCKYCNSGYFLYLTFCLKNCPMDQWAIISLNVCNDSCDSTLFMLVQNRTCLQSCSAYYNEKRQCIGECSSNQMANSTLGCESCEKLDCSNRLLYKLQSYIYDGALYFIVKFNYAIDSLSYFEEKTISFEKQASPVISPEQLEIAALRKLQYSKRDKTVSFTINQQSLYHITFKLDKQQFTDSFTSNFISTVNDLRAFSFYNFPLQIQNSTLLNVQYHQHQGGPIFQYIGIIISFLLLFLYLLTFICDNDRVMIIPIDGIQSIHAMLYLNVWNHPYVENYMIGLRFSGLRSYLSNFSVSEDVWICDQKRFLLFELCNTYLELALPLMVLIMLLILSYLFKQIQLLKGKHKFYWSHLSSLWWITSLGIGLASTYGLSENTSGQKIISIIFCSLFFLLSIRLSFQIIKNVYSKSFEDSCFFWDLKKRNAQKELSNLHYFLIVLRRIILIISVSFGNNSPLSSLFIITLLTICIISNIIINKPFKKYGMAVGSAEILFGIILIFFQMYIVNSSKLSNQGWNIYGIITFILIFIYNVILLMIGLRQSIKIVKKTYFKCKTVSKQTQYKKQKFLSQKQQPKYQQSLRQPRYQNKQQLSEQSQHNLMRHNLNASPKQSVSSHIFSQYNIQFGESKGKAPKILLKIQKNQLSQE